MEGDKVIINARHRKIASEILSNIKPRLKPKFILSVGGEANVGKTETCIVLRSMLRKIGVSSLIVSMNDYYGTTYDQRNKQRKLTGVIGSQEIMWSWLFYTITKYMETDTTLVLTSSKYRRGVAELLVHSKDVDCLIMDGLYACQLMCADYRVHIKGEYTNSWVRNFMKRKHEKISRLRTKVLAIEHKEVEDARGFADMEVG